MSNKFITTLAIVEACRVLARSAFDETVIATDEGPLRALLPNVRSFHLDGDGQHGHIVYMDAGDMGAVQLGHDLETPITVRKPEDYATIRSWGLMMRSFEYYIKGEQEKAASMFAPLDALYERDGLWVLKSGLAAGHEFHALHAQRMSDMVRS